MAFFSKLPKDFLWGAATSAHQVEGGNRNDWSEWEKQNASRLASEAEQKFGHLPSWPHIREQATNPQNYISGIACDHYHRFREDFDIAQSLGHNAHRFSLEWSRIEPEEGKFDEREIEHYREVIAALRERGIEPLVTLWHWTLPVWVRRQGGWESKKTLRDFVRYAAQVGLAYKDGVHFWTVLNEPEYWIAHTYIGGTFPPGRRNIWKVPLAYWRMSQAHAAAYRALKTVNPHCAVGIVQSTGWIDPAYARFFLNYFRNFLFPSLVRGSFDFFGLNYYRSVQLMGKIPRERSEIGWEIYPEGLYRLAQQAYRRYGKPILITENGIADAADTQRAAYIRAHVRSIERAVAEGVDIRGYLHWSLLDNFEWESGFCPRFGLVEVDYTTMERKIRPSARAYRAIIDAHRSP